MFTSSPECMGGGTDVKVPNKSCEEVQLILQSKFKKKKN
jgi:hypothetical protein